MKQQLWRRQAAAYDFLHDMQPRYDDIDPERHINNVAMQSLYFEAQARFQLHALQRDPLEPHALLLYPLHTDTAFLHAGHDGLPVRCGLRLLALDETGYTLAMALFQEGHCIGLQECRMAAWSGGARVDLPEAMREKLAPHLHSHDDAPPTPLTRAGHAAGATDIDSYSYLHSVSLRFSDADTDACISAAAVARYLEQARSQLIMGMTEPQAEEPLAGELGMLTARVAIDTIAHRRANGNIRIAAGLTHAGNTSLALRVGLFDESGCFAVADNVLVMVDPDDGRPCPLPASLRDRLGYWPYRQG